MSARRVVLIWLLLLGALMLRAAPVWAHTGPGTSLAEDVFEPVAEPGPVSATIRELPGRALSASPEAPGLPWPALLAALAAVALGRRRPRRAVALALVLLLAVFAFEGARHSVHHGFDARFSGCAMATAVAHLTAIEVDSSAPSQVILPLAAMAAEIAHGAPAARFASPDQGRAPPLSIS